MTQVSHFLEEIMGSVDVLSASTIVGTKVCSICCGDEVFEVSIKSSSFGFKESLNFWMLGQLLHNTEFK
jgi:hypothetical protein